MLKKIPKSKKENEKWTFLRMSIFQNPKKVSKTPHFSLLHHYANNYYFCVAKTVMLIFKYFSSNYCLALF
jgi:hypothetical protein